MEKQYLYGTRGINNFLIQAIKELEEMKNKSTNIFIKFKLWKLIRKSKKVLYRK